MRRDEVNIKKDPQRQREHGSIKAFRNRNAFRVFGGRIESGR